jgi:hypothetical protein
MDIKEYPPLSSIKESSIIVKEITKDNIVISQGMNSKGLQHKEDHSLPGIKICFMVLFLFVITLEIKL